MIQVMVRENEISVKGHAGFAPHGRDLVCAAVSALTLTLAESLNALAEGDIKTVMDTGNISVRWQRINDKGKTVIDSWFLGICLINQEYGCITYV